MATCCIKHIKHKAIKHMDKVDLVIGSNTLFHSSPLCDSLESAELTYSSLSFALIWNTITGCFWSFAEIQPQGGVALMGRPISASVQEGKKRKKKPTKTKRTALLSHCSF